MSYQINSKISHPITGLDFFKEQDESNVEIYLFAIQIYKNIFGVGRLSKILCNFQSGSWQMLTSAYKVGGWGEKRPKICLGNTYLNGPNI